MHVITQYECAMMRVVDRAKHRSPGFYTKEDKKFLKSIYKDESKDSKLRFSALSCWARILELVGCPSEASTAWCLCLKMYNDKQVVIDGMDLGDNCEKNLMLCMKFLMERRQRFTLPTFHLPGGEQKKVFTIGGIQCDWCGVVEELGDDFLQCCGNCKLSYYCSKECQKKDWNEGRHISECRKRGHYHVGDTALFADRYCLIPMVILMPLKWEGGGKPRKLLVLPLSSDWNMDCMVLNAQVLQRLRPAAWSRAFGDVTLKKRQVLEEVKCRQIG
jgi:MYND finger